MMTSMEMDESNNTSGGGEATVGLRPAPQSPTTGDDANTAVAAPAPAEVVEDEQQMDHGNDGPEGCYLTFESSSGGRLMLVYSRGVIPRNAVGFWCPGPDHQIQGFKFKQAGGKSELIKGIAGGDQNRRKYFSGWCQFIKQAKAMNGYVIKFPNAPQGVEVDVVGYKTKEEKAYELDLDVGLLEVGELDAVAVVPKHNPTFHGIHTINKTNFLEMGQLAGAATTL
mmetsp:Transcript_45058/g.109565  ORF Transcript_45058/g.109565 Transcript_45058/m.109565 type:complete len:225 (-) Transcript_45058:203-877(-)